MVFLKQNISSGLRLESQRTVTLPNRLKSEWPLFRTPPPWGFPRSNECNVGSAYRASEAKDFHEGYGFRFARFECGVRRNPIGSNTTVHGSLRRCDVKLVHRDLHVLHAKEGW